MEEWVRGLREAKEFWVQHRKRKEFTLPLSVYNEEDNLHVVSTLELQM